MTRPRSALTLSLAQGPLLQEGGKGRRGRGRASIGTQRPLDRWLLQGRKAEGTSSGDVEEDGAFRVSEDFRREGGGDENSQK